MAIRKIATIRGNTSQNTALPSQIGLKRNGTYSKIYLQFVFAVRYREALLHASWEEELFKYITGIVQNKGQLLLAINGHVDHIHILVSLRPTCRINDLVCEIKKASNEFINSKQFVRGHFAWQEGYGVFSYTHWHLDTVIHYIRNQKEHHKRRTFKEEYTELLQQFSIEFKDEYLFEWLGERAA